MCLQNVCKDVKIETRNETLRNVNGIRTAERAYEAMFDEFIPVDACPTPTPVGMERVSTAGCRDFSRLGWQPLSGETRCQYSVDLVGEQGQRLSDGFEVMAVCDVDGDSVKAVYVATWSKEAKATTPPDVY